MDFRIVEKKLLEKISQTKAEAKELNDKISVTDDKISVTIKKIEKLDKYIKAMERFIKVG
jgi:peptidoglycan hydrolase CwlO-like protein